jgi:hypothetical protein
MYPLCIRNARSYIILLHFAGLDLYVGLPTSTDKSHQLPPKALSSSSSSAAAAAADAAASHDQADNPHQTVVRVITDLPADAAADEPGGSSCSSSDAGDDDVAAADSMPSLSISPLCPVVSLDSCWGQACFKLLLHVAAYTGEGYGFLGHGSCCLHLYKHSHHFASRLTRPTLCWRLCLLGQPLPKCIDSQFELIRGR